MAHLLRDRAIWNRGGKQNGVLFPAKYLHQVLDERFKGRFSYYYYYIYFTLNSGLNNFFFRLTMN